MLNRIVLFFFCLLSSAAVAQDSVRVMTLEDYYRVILARHPIVKQASTFSQEAKAQIRMSKGLLDPKAEVSYGGKELAGTEYYQLWDNTLKVPVWFGTDFKFGFERNTGQAVNGESETPSSGLIYAGITVPLGQGLFIDERRNAVLQARMLPQMAEAERINAVNGVLLKATNDYWDWYMAWKRYELLDSAYSLALNRFEAVKARALQGDAPAIDTVEALIAVQERDILRSQALADYQNAMSQASVHLWAEGDTPLELTPNVHPFSAGLEPSAFTGTQLDSLTAQARVNHPDLQKLDVKQKQLAIEERYQRDKLKPQLNFQYNLLTKDLNSFSDPGNTDFYRNNYKMGVQFSYPLLLRKERGKIQQTEIKQQQVSFERQQKERDVLNNIQVSYNNWIALEQQIKVQDAQVRNARTLRDAEQTRFFAGESSFFLVNTREMSLITSEIRLIELQTRYAKNKARLYWAAGTLIAQ